MADPLNLDAIRDHYRRADTDMGAAMTVSTHIPHLVAEVEALRAKLARIDSLYEARCAATVNKWTEGEEMFLADLSMVLNDEN